MIEDILKYSEVDSNRFGLKVYRGVLEEWDTEAIKQFILNHNPDLLILRLSVAIKESQYKIFDLEFPVIHADTLVYYSVSLTDIKIDNLKNNLDFVELDDSNTSELDKLLPLIFEGYKNHYFSNPFLDKKAILDGYIEWGKSYTTKSATNRISWLIYENKVNVGFVSYHYNTKTNECEGVLHGMHPGHSGKGLYGDIIKFTQKYFRDRGFIKMIISTQVQNFNVQKSWVKEGFFLTKAYDTYHINSFLSYSVIPKYDFTICIDKKDILKFADFSGDYTKIYLDDAIAQQSGFEGAISHEVISSSILSKFYGTEFPGYGTVFLDYSYSFYRPVYHDRNYQCIVSFHFIDKVKGLYKSVARILDSNGNICLIAYHSLSKKTA